VQIQAADGWHFHRCMDWWDMHGTLRECIVWNMDTDIRNFGSSGPVHLLGAITQKQNLHYHSTALQAWYLSSLICHILWAYPRTVGPCILVLHQEWKTAVQKSRQAEIQLYRCADNSRPVSFTVSAWEWVYATNLSRLQRETGEREREKQANGTWEKHTVYQQQRSYYLNVWVVTEEK
jgi:hypothetical protein